MDRPHLKLYNPSEAVDSSNARTQSKSSPKVETTMHRVVGEARVAVSVGDLLPLLADAWQTKRAWLHDFSGDRVIVSQDLYEVLLAYKRMRAA